MSFNLQTPIDYLKRVGPNRATLLKEELDIYTYQDLLNLFPNRYLDRTKYFKIKELVKSNAEIKVIGKITKFQDVGTGRAKRLVATFRDETGSMELVLFRGAKWINGLHSTTSTIFVFR